MVIFLFTAKKGSENAKKIKRFGKEDIKQQLINFRINNDIIETEKLNEKADKRDKSEDAATIIR